MANLIRLGTNKWKAYQWANTRKGYWHTTGGFILATTITIDRLRSAGYVFLSDYYLKVRHGS